MPAPVVRRRPRSAAHNGEGERKADRQPNRSRSPRSTVRPGRRIVGSHSHRRRIAPLVLRLHADEIFDPRERDALLLGERRENIALTHQPRFDECPSEKAPRASLHGESTMKVLGPKKPVVHENLAELSVGNLITQTAARHASDEGIDADHAHRASCAFWWNDGVRSSRRRGRSGRHRVHRCRRRGPR